jgi:hypothetical protein
MSVAPHTERHSPSTQAWHVSAGTLQSRVSVHSLRHWPFSQIAIPISRQSNPHPPQFAGSVSKSTHSPDGQGLWPAEQGTQVVVLASQRSFGRQQYVPHVA